MGRAGGGGGTQSYPGGGHSTGRSSGGHSMGGSQSGSLRGPAGGFKAAGSKSKGPVSGPKGPVGGPKGPVGGPKGPVGGPKRPAGGPKGPVGGPKRPVGGPKGPVGGPKGHGPHGWHMEPPPEKHRSGGCLCSIIIFIIICFALSSTITWVVKNAGKSNNALSAEQEITHEHEEQDSEVGYRNDASHMTEDEKIAWAED